MKIALVDVPNIDCPSGKRVGPSLTLGYLAGILDRNSYEVQIFDSRKWRLSFDKTLGALIKVKPQIVGFTSSSENRFATIDVIKKIKAAINPFVIVGGPHFTFTAEDALKNIPEIDVVVRFEGELTLLELVKNLSQGKRIDDIDGISFRDKAGQIVHNKDRDFLLELDTLPIPAWHLFDLGLYNDVLPKFKDRFVGILSSRGCPSRCAFCANAVSSKHSLRLRSPAKVVDEIEFLNKKFGYSAFKFEDDTITMVKRHIMQICGEIIKRNLNIEWSAGARVDRVDDETLKLMRKAGCRIVSYGIESGSQKVLDTIKKDITVEQIRKAVKLSADAGFDLIAAYFMVSHPGEEKGDLAKTVALMKELKGYSPNVAVSFGFSLIYPGTELERLAKESGCLAKDFSWNTYARFSKHYLTNSIPEIPYFENKKFGLLAIKMYLFRRYQPLSSKLKRVFQKGKALIKIK